MMRQNPTMTGNICDDDEARWAGPGVLSRPGAPHPGSIAAAAREPCRTARRRRLERPDELARTARSRAAQHPRRGPRRSRGGAPARGRRDRLRAPALRPHGRHRPRPPRQRRAAPLPGRQSLLGREARRRRDRRLRPRHARAGLRRRSPVPAALQADRLGRERRRGDALRAVGPEAEGRPRDPLGRRLPARGEGGHDDPHLAPRSALPPRRPRRSTTRFSPASTRRSSRQRRPSSSTRSSRSATPASPRPAPRATSSSRTSRTARAGLRDLNTLFWIAKYVYRVREPKELVEAGLFTPGRVPALRALRGIPVAGALPHAFRDRPGRGAARPSTCSASSPSASARPGAAGSPASSAS